MIIKLEKVISCTSEHPSYPANNLLHQRTNSSWRCAKPGELLASVIFQLIEPSTITGLDIGNYRSCIVVVTASTSEEPDNWIPIINHQFMSHDEAANAKFKDQVQLFSKKELNPETLKIKFSRVKLTCMQSANLREIFGLAFIVLRTEVTLELGNDIFGRFKLKESSATFDAFKEKCMKKLTNKSPTYRDNLVAKIKEDSADNFAKRQVETREPMKRPILEKLEERGRNIDESDDIEKLPISDNEKKKKDDTPKRTNKATRLTPFGDVINIVPTDGADKKMAKKRSVLCDNSSDEEEEKKKKKEKEKIVTKNFDVKCSVCTCDDKELDRVCEKCKKLPIQKILDFRPMAKKPKILVKPTKEFGKLFDDVKFALSGYVNPRRNEIRERAMRMGGKYIADPNTSDNKCSHLVCAFKNTPKSQQLRGHAKIVSEKFVDECYDKKTRFPWRRFALDGKDKTEPESEEEIEGFKSAVKPLDPYQQDTDPDSDY